MMEKLIKIAHSQNSSERVQKSLELGTECRVVTPIPTHPQLLGSSLFFLFVKVDNSLKQNCFSPFCT